MIVLPQARGFGTRKKYTTSNIYTVNLLSLGEAENLCFLLDAFLAGSGLWAAQTGRPESA